MRRQTPSICFATFLVPHVLFVADPVERVQVAHACCLAWNIALFPETAERERQIRTVMDVLMADTVGTPPPDFREGYADELRMLADLKRDLFPWQNQTIHGVELVSGPRCDTLVVDGGRSAERIDIAINPPLVGLRRVAEVLTGMAADTTAQRRTLESASRTPGLVEAVATPDMVTTYCVQRADLRGYERMLTAWTSASVDPATSAIADWLFRLITGIETDTQTVLAILVAALDGAERTLRPARH